MQKQKLKVVILGSTGSLGAQSLEVLRKYKNHFKIIGLSAYKNAKLLSQQAKKWHISKNTTILAENNSKKLYQLAKLKKADIVVNVISGIGGIEPSKIALKAGKTLLLGNKESMVAEGKNLQKFSNQIIPLDSEHNAIFEILRKFPDKKIKKITIPCSGGPFWNKSKKELEKVTIKDVMSHPRWKMGPKICVESATLLNKGLEIIEAHFLFRLPLSKIETVIHPECRVHGMVEFTDGSEYAYISPPDMKEHIENALSYAGNLSPLKRQIRTLKPREFTFQNPNHKDLKGIEVVLKAFKKNPRAMKKILTKEEKIINLFLNHKVQFLEIFKLL